MIHTVGPVWNDGKNNEEKILADCYLNSLNVAIGHSIKTIAFPNISTGIYRFPKKLAANIAVKTVQDFFTQNNTIDKVSFVCFDSENYEIYEQILKIN